jgi:capping protein beta
MYFEGGVSSVYLWDLEDEGAQTGKEMMFAGVVLLKKSTSMALYLSLLATSS